MISLFYFNSFNDSNNFELFKILDYSGVEIQDT